MYFLKCYCKCTLKCSGIRDKFCQRLQCDYLEKNLEFMWLAFAYFVHGLFNSSHFWNGISFCPNIALQDFALVKFHWNSFYLKNATYIKVIASKIELNQLRNFVQRKNVFQKI